MRTFIAIEFEEEIKDYMEEIKNRVQGYCKKGSFTKKENFHLTLRFIGETNSEEMEQLKEAAAQTAFKCRPFELKFKNIGFFPRGNRSIIWTGIEESRELRRMYGILEKALEGQGFRRDRQGLSPHITLAREAELYVSQQALKDKVQVAEKTFQVTKISLMESTRIGANLVYRPIFVSNLGR